jgi:hypothetical protein
VLEENIAKGSKAEVCLLVVCGRFSRSIGLNLYGDSYKLQSNSVSVKNCLNSAIDHSPKFDLNLTFKDRDHSKVFKYIS